MQAITRLADPSDLNFILNSFLKSLRAYPAFEHIPNDIYYVEQKRVLEEFITAGRPIILCNSEDPDQIFGYIIGVPNVCTNFVYIKYPYRKFGFAKRLLLTLHTDWLRSPVKASYTCRNWGILSKKFSHVYSPYRG
jgi:hypothetical protein